MTDTPSTATTRSVLWATLATLMLVCTGCSILEPQADLTQFYVLRTRPAGGEQLAGAQEAETGIRVGPGRIAGYLEKTMIAVQAEPNRMRYLDLHRWAEPLDRGLSRVLAANLAARLDTSRVSVYPDPPVSEAGYEVHYTVHRFEGPLDGAITLEVTWQVVDQSSSNSIVTRRSTHVVDAGQARDVTAYVERLSEAVGQWADEIATAIP